MRPGGALPDARRRSRRRDAPPRAGPDPVLPRARASPPPCGPGPRAAACACGPRRRIDECAAAAVERMRFALGTDHDLSEFHRRFWRDPLLGPILRRKPWLRPRRRPEPFEALAWAITEQLIDGGRAVSIQRRLVARHGAISPCGSLRDVPSAVAIARLVARADGGLRPLAPAGDHDDQGGAGGGRRAGWTWTATSPPGPGCARSRASGRGRSSAWRCTARAATTSFRRATSPTSSSSARCARLGRRATEDEVREFFEPYAAVRRAGRHHAGTRIKAWIHHVTKTEQEWREQLSPDRYHVLREKGTEPPFTGAYTHSKAEGHLQLRRLRERAVPLRHQVRLRHGLAELHRAGGGRERAPGGGHAATA